MSDAVQTPRTVRMPAAERRAQLLDAALRVFAEQGFHLASMNDIADAAGVTKPVLYQHFSSKRALYLEVLRDVGAQLREEVAKGVAAAPTPREQVELGIAAYFRWVDEFPLGFAVLFVGDTRRDPEFLAESQRVESEMADFIAELIEVEGLTVEQRRMLAYGVVGLAETTCRHWLAHDLELPAETLANGVAQLSWAGLRGLGPSPTPTP